MKPIGILGGGQLARMMALAAHPLGLRCRVYDPAPQPPAAAVAEHVRGDFDDGDALRRFASGLEVATYELEHLPASALAALDGYVEVRPGPQALHSTADRWVEKSFVQGLGIATTEFAAVDSEADLSGAADRLGLPLVLKTRTHGYDGHGQAMVRSRAECAPALSRLGSTGLLAEAWVPFDRELSLVVVRSPSGEVRTYPLVENHHDGGILRWTLAPATAVDSDIREQAEVIARRIVRALDYVGVLTVELFQVGARLLVNELAPRVHNSGHWTIEGAETSQFENHLRAVLGLPLGATTATDSWVLFNLLGEAPDLRRVLELPGAHIHVYDKVPRLGRKLGHVTCRARDPGAARPRLQEILGLA